MAPVLFFLCPVSLESSHCSNYRQRWQACLFTNVIPKDKMLPEKEVLWLVFSLPHICQCREIWLQFSDLQDKDNSLSCFLMGEKDFSPTQLRNMQIDYFQRLMIFSCQWLLYVIFASCKMMNKKCIEMNTTKEIWKLTELLQKCRVDNCGNKNVRINSYSIWH